MAANNFFGYPAPHGQPGATPSYPAAAAQAVPTAPTNPAAPAPAAYPAPPAAVAVAAGVQPAPPAAVAYNQAAAVAAAASAASSYRSAPQAVVAYTAYQPQNAAAVTGATYVASGAGPVVPATYPGTTYTQYPPQPTAAQVYDPNKSGPTAAAAAAAPYYAAQPSGVSVTVTYSMSDPHYQARPVYSANSNVAVVGRPAAIITGPPRPSYTTYAQSSSTPSFSYGAPGAMSASVTAGPKHIYVQNQATVSSMNLTPVVTVGTAHNPVKVAPQPQYPRGGKPGGVTAPGQRGFKARVAPKPQELHYCEVCKISCAGPQTYKEHLEGQKHKKKEAALKAGTPAPTTRSGNALRCELCDVTCTGSDAYAAHIRGAKHQKVVKLHTKLGKPIPSVNPVVVGKTESQLREESPVATGSSSEVSQAKTTFQAAKPVVPKIMFVKSDAAAVGNTKAASSPAGGAKNQQGQTQVTIPRLPEEKDVQPVGHEYIEEMKNGDGKVISFNCKLCECRFNDPNAKEMHMKGRRHRLQYKKKVNPDLVVDVKPSMRQRKMAEEKAKRSQAREEFWRRREEEFRLVEEEERAYWDERSRFDEADMYDSPMMRRYPGNPRMFPNHRFGPPGFFFAGPPGRMMRRPDTIDDRHVLAKHAQIYPTDEELDEIQKLVLSIEKALKLVSDQLLQEATGNGSKEKASNDKTKEKDDPNANRILKGVMRIGVLAKGLILKGDSRFCLVVLTSQKPTVSLLDKVLALLPANLNETGSFYNFEVVKKLDNIGFSVIQRNVEENPVTIDVMLTSPLMRDHQGSDEVTDILNPDKCLEALAALRHAKWFQARAQGRQSCVLTIRILRDFCQRMPTWTPLKLFAIELLVEKVLTSAGMPLSPGDALRRVFESLAGGMLLTDAPGLLDPCEKDPQDAAKDLTPQQREDITREAQHALRLIAFRQVYKVLGVEPLPPPKFGRARFARKRRRDDSSAEKEEEEQEEKKDKVEVEAVGASEAVGGGGESLPNQGVGDDDKAK